MNTYYYECKTFTQVVKKIKRINYCKPSSLEKNIIEPRIRKTVTVSLIYWGYMGFMKKLEDCRRIEETETDYKLTFKDKTLLWKKDEIETFTIASNSVCNDIHLMFNTKYNIDRKILERDWLQNEEE